MTSKYSNSILFYDWPPEWKLEEDDADQMEADNRGTETEVIYWARLVYQMEESHRTQGR